MEPPAIILIQTEEDAGMRVAGTCGRAGILQLARVQAERRSDGQWNVLVHVRNATPRGVAFTLSLRAAGRELANPANQPYRVEGGATLVVPTGPSSRPVPTAEVAASLVLNCPM